MESVVGLQKQHEFQESNEIRGEVVRNEQIDGTNGRKHVDLLLYALHRVRVWS
jgi:hypothetical protein